MGGILVMMEMSLSWLYNVNILIVRLDYEMIPIVARYEFRKTGFPYYFYNYMRIYNYVKIKRLIQKIKRRLKNWIFQVLSPERQPTLYGWEWGFPPQQMFMSTIDSPQFQNEVAFNRERKSLPFLPFTLFLPQHIGLFWAF